MKFTFSKKIYPKTAFIKSAYAFTDRAYLHLDEDEENYIADITPKDKNILELKEFENEMLYQTVKYKIYKQTKDIRTLTVARALSSTIIEEKSSFDDSKKNNDEYCVDDVLKDWFSSHE